MKEDKEDEGLAIPNREVIEHIDSYFDGDEECVLARKMAESLANLDKPFGISWDFELVRDFLEKRGYKVIVRIDEEYNCLEHAYYNTPSYHIPQKKY